MLKINNPEHAKQRAEVKPLTLEEEQMAVGIINNYATSLYFLRDRDSKEIARQFVKSESYELLQRLLWSYENYRHFFDVVGGWEDVSKKWISVSERLPEYDVNVLVYELKHNSESYAIGSYDEDGYWNTASLMWIPGTMKPSHWMPLPQPPKTE